MYMKRVSHGVGGSYTKWQRKPPAHSVYMAKNDSEYTTVTVWHERGQVVGFKDGSMGPKNIPFKHDRDIEDMEPAARDEFWDYINRDIAERYADNYEASRETGDPEFDMFGGS